MFLHVLIIMAGFTYIKNSFYIEADEKSMNDSITISNYLRGGTYSAKEDFINAINLDHEMNHYVQELFIKTSNIGRMFRFSLKGKCLMISLNLNNLDKHFIFYLIDLFKLIEENMKKEAE